ncbi:lysine transporter LysE [Pandoraea thiooxydans]|uniref:Lysine transporter LysE n=1 Tax=Pandoraea thiooxydans TaxID=445709 RepID=A0A0G3ES63_9BURK|nr:LysE family translocator [Pandoraea thiooxydans]AKJ67521.1 lysine transporter LysE [Pandoraea thiooxydans]APR94583.1 lysine transporter LysE [Pandoraea thiooxydans]
MPDLSTIGTFVAVVLGLFLIPGPAVLLVLTRTVQGGPRVGIATGLGIATGDALHTLCASIGLSALLMTSALAFNVVKWMGAAYLVYLGMRALRAKPVKSNEPASDLTEVPEISRVATSLTAGRAYLQAIPTELLNPKTALFFLAFLPQFVHASQGAPFVQFAVLGAIFVMLSALYTSLIALTIRPLGRMLKRLAWLRRWQNQLIGLIFISLGLKVATQTR